MEVIGEGLILVWGEAFCGKVGDLGFCFWVNCTKYDKILLVVVVEDYAVHALLGDSFDQGFESSVDGLLYGCGIKFIAV